MLKQNLPNLVTLANLCCGCLGILYVFSGDTEGAAYFVLLAAAFDLVDGMLARALNVHSEIGKDLDSLADVVSFGVLPGFLAFSLIISSFFESDYAAEQTMSAFQTYSPYLFLLIPVFSAVRLARFNNDSRQKDSFIGLPVPANGLFWAGLTLGIHDKTWWLLNHPVILVLLTPVFSLLLVSGIPMFSFKFTNMAWAGNQLRFLFIAACLPILFFLKLPGLSAIIVLFVLVSIATSMLKKGHFESTNRP
jgi:CDP-diacylglycerol--serine O-phosphatidyltransferase